MERNMEMYEQRHELLKEFIGRGMRASMILKLTEPMQNTSEPKRSLRQRLEDAAAIGKVRHIYHLNARARRKPGMTPAFSFLILCTL